MSFVRKEKGGSALLKIEGPMTVNEAAALRDEMVACFDKYDGLILDINEVTECDSAGIQLLYSARLTAQSMGKIFNVSSASRCSRDTIAQVGLSPDEILNTANME